MPASRDTITLPRWGRTAAGVDAGSPGVVEPSSQKKDTGWVENVDTPNPSWWNWLHRETGKMLEYLEALVQGVTAVDDQILRTQKSAGGTLTRTADYTVSVSELEVLIGGALYVIPTTSLDHGTQSSLATMHRIIVAELNSGSPRFFVVDGTVDATDPTLTVGQIPLHRIRQASGAGGANAPTDDLRVFGILSAGSLTVDTTADIGGILQVSGGNTLTIGSTLLQAETIGNASLTLDGQSLNLSSTETVREDIYACDWTPFGTSLPTFGGSASHWDLPADSQVLKGINPPLGAAFKNIQVAVGVNAGATVTVTLHKRTKGTFGANLVVAQISTTTTGVGVITLTPSLTIAIVSESYAVGVSVTGGTATVHDAIVRYDILANPLGLEAP